MTEKEVKALVRAELLTHDHLWFFMPAANGYGTPGIPDFVGIWKGYGFTIECKAGRGRQSQWQERQEAAVVTALAPYFLIHDDNVHSFHDMFTGWQNLCS